MSPEIFTSRGSSRASDLWAIGCVLYQMVTGIPPFQSKSEYIIFKKIEKLEYSFHEGFDDDAKDLVKRLLVIEPKERLGARDKSYYTSIRTHPFFKGFDFDSLSLSAPAAFEPFVQAADIPDPVWTKYPNTKPGVGRLVELMCGQTSSDEELLERCGNSEDTTDGVGALVYTDTKKSRSKKSVLQSTISDEERRAKIKLQSQTNEYHKFVEGHLILKQGNRKEELIF